MHDAATDIEGHAVERGHAAVALSEVTDGNERGHAHGFWGRIRFEEDPPAPFAWIHSDSAASGCRPEGIVPAVTVFVQGR